MKRAVLLLAPLLLASQDPTGGKLKPLLERLASDAVAEREEASREIMKLGPGVLPALKKARESARGELAVRLGKLARMLELREMLGPGLSAAFPGIEERLARGAGASWTELLLSAEDRRLRGDRRITRKDLVTVYPRALSGAESVEERVKILRLAGNEGLRDVVPLLARHLGHAEPELRAAAAGSLERLDARETLGKIRPLLKDPEPEVRAAAVTAVAAFGGPAVAGDIIPLIHDSGTDVHEDAIRILVTWRVADALPKLVKRSQTAPEDEVYAAMAAALEIARGEKRREIFRELLEKAKPEFRELVPMAASRSEIFELEPELARLLESPGADMRRVAAEGLQEIGGPGSIPALLGALRDTDAQVRMHAIWALGWIGTPEAISHLRKMALDPRHPLRDLAADALVHQGDASVVPQFVESLETADDDALRLALNAFRIVEAPEAITKALGVLSRREVKDPKAILAISRLGHERGDEGVPLGKLLRQEDLSVLRRILARDERTLTRMVLGLLSDAPHLPSGPIAIAILAEEGGSREIRQAACRVLALHAPGRALSKFRKTVDETTWSGKQRVMRLISDYQIREGIPYLIERALEEEIPGSEDDIVRGVAMGELGDLGAAEAIPLLSKKVIGTDDPRTAVHTLGRIGTPEAVEILLPLLDNRRNDVRERALMSVERGAGRKIIPRLREFLTDADARMRIWAVQLLTSFGGQEHVAAIEPLIGDPDPLVRGQAIRALRILRAGPVPPEVTRLVDHPSPWIRRQATWWALASGRASPASRLVGGDWSQELQLNALAEAETFRKLEVMVPRGWQAKGTRVEIARKLAEERGVELDVADSLGPMWRRDIDEEWQYESSRWYATYFEAIQEILMQRGAIVTPGLTLILEPGRVRVVPLREASEHWRTWWAKRNKAKRHER